MGNKIEVSFVRGSDGSIDVENTLSAWRNDLEVYASNESADLQTIAQAVSRVWDDNPTLKSMNLDAIASFTMRHIPNVAPSAYNDVSERIKEYVRSATDLFALTKGKGGGVQLLSRLTTEEKAKVEEQRTKAAAKAAEKAAAEKATAAA